MKQETRDKRIEVIKCSIQAWEGNLEGFARMVRAWPDNDYYKRGLSYSQKRVQKLRQRLEKLNEKSN